MVYSNDLRKDFSLMRFFIKSMGKDVAAQSKGLRYLKERIRNTIRLKNADRPKYVFVGDDCFERMCTKEVIDCVMTRDEIDAYTEDNWEHWYNPYDDGRDCTGVWFTTRIKCFPIPATGKTIVYHWKNCDI